MASNVCYITHRTKEEIKKDLPDVPENKSITAADNPLW